MGLRMGLWMSMLLVLAFSSLHVAVAQTHADRVLKKIAESSEGLTGDADVYAQAVPQGMLGFQWRPAHGWKKHQHKEPVTKRSHKAPSKKEHDEHKHASYTDDHSRPDEEDEDHSYAPPDNKGYDDNNAPSKKEDSTEYQPPSWKECDEYYSGKKDQDDNSTPTPSQKDSYRPPAKEEYARPPPTGEEYKHQPPSQEGYTRSPSSDPYMHMPHSSSGYHAPKETEDEDHYYAKPPQRGPHYRPGNEHYYTGSGESDYVHKPVVVVPVPGPPGPPGPSVGGPCRQYNNYTEVTFTGQMSADLNYTYVYAACSDPTSTDPQATYMMGSECNIKCTDPADLKLSTLLSTRAIHGYNGQADCRSATTALNYCEIQVVAKCCVPVVPAPTGAAAARKGGSSFSSSNGGSNGPSKTGDRDVKRA